MKNIILSFVICTSVIYGASGQTSRIPYRNYTFGYIESDSVLFRTYGDSSTINCFYEKLDRLIFEGSGNLHIVHFGASHIQAGIWPWQIRCNFENMSRCIEGGPGYVFPFSIAKTNHPYYYRSSYEGNWEIAKITDQNVSCPIGVGGITAICSDSIAEIGIQFNKTADIYKHSFDKVSVFHSDIKGTYSVSLIPESAVNYSTFDSVSGATVFYLNRECDSLNLLFQKTDSGDDTLYFYGAYLVKMTNGIHYSGIGINGASTISYFKAGRLQQQLCCIDPDLIVFSIGVNDASGKNFTGDRYADNYWVLLSMVREVCPAAAIILTTNSDFYYYRGSHNEHAGEVLQAMNQVAAEFGASVWDFHAAMGGNRSINLWKQDGLAQRDRIHFTQEGYTILARLFFEAIQKDFEQYIIRNALNQQ
ncbi:MAG TPA: GDSL-type esterase/lipase family protein [Bacteroidales bacterium]|mgnify:FL=1|nr:GDSL-type esterase/lipase family protein [Bacteroidales bacterium]